MPLLDIKTATPHLAPDKVRLEVLLDRETVVSLQNSWNGDIPDKLKMRRALLKFLCEVDLDLLTFTTVFGEGK